MAPEHFSTINPTSATIGNGNLSADEFVAEDRDHWCQGFEMKDQVFTTLSMTVSEVSDQLAALVGRVSRRETRVIVEEAGMPAVAIVAVDDLERLDRLDRERAEQFRVIDRLQEAFKDVSAEEIDREADRAVAAIRAESRTEP